jgi:Flp pilus assembly protein TadG
MLPISLWRARGGVAALEFGVTAPLLLALAGGLTDVGLLCQARGQVNLGLAAGAQYATLAGTNATKAAAQTAMTSATGLAVTFTATVPACYCISTTGGVSSLTSQTCGVNCSDGTTPGTYMELSASYTYQPITPGMSNMVATALSATIYARLQ